MCSCPGSTPHPPNRSHERSGPSLSPLRAEREIRDAQSARIRRPQKWSCCHLIARNIDHVPPTHQELARDRYLAAHVAHNNRAAKRRAVAGGGDLAHGFAVAEDALSAPWKCLGIVEDEEAEALAWPTF